MIAIVLVGVAVSRPVVVDETFRKVLIAGDSEQDCLLLAAQMVTHSNVWYLNDVEMPTSSKILDILEI